MVRHVCVLSRIVTYSKCFVYFMKTVASVCALAGDRIVSAAYDAIVKLWDSVTGECLNMLEGHTEVSGISGRHYSVHRAV